MKRRICLAGALVVLLWATPARADTGVIVRTSNLAALQTLCALPTTCTISPVGALDGTLGQLFLVTTPLPLQTFLGLLNGLSGLVSAEADQVLNLVGGLNVVPTPLDPALMSDRTPVVYPAGSTNTAWNSYVNQPAASVVEVQNAQSQFHAMGTGIVADIDTGVDPNHPVLQPVLLPGYDFTRNQPGGSEMNDLPPTFPQPNPCDSTTCPSPILVNQSSAAILDQSSAAILDTNTQYAAFGHGTMVMGVIHLVAPTAQLLPLKAFNSNGTANLSDILRAIYYAVQNSANVINMSFDTKTASPELKNALDYASQLGLTSVASAGNDGAQETVYPAALQSDVMGVASVGSTSTTDSTRSSFSNFGNSIVWVAAPGEQIITTYPFSTYAAGWGTSFSAPFVSGGAALLHNLTTAINQSAAASAMAHAVPLADPGMGNGRLDLVPALQSISGAGGSPDFTVSASPSGQTIAAGENTNFTVSVAPQGGFNQTVTWNCAGAPVASTCSVSPSSVTLDGTHAATATVTLKTTSRGLAPPLILPRGAPPWHLWVIWAAGFALLAALLLVCKFGGTARVRPGLATAGVLAVSLWTYSCGGYGTGGGSGSPTLSSLTVSPSNVTGGSSATGTVTLSGSAAYGGAAVSLTSNMSAATVPANVTVASGASSANFTVTTTAVTSSTSATITATLGTTTKTATLTVTPATGGTPAGTYMLTVTGSSGSLSHSSTVQITVN